MPVMSRMLTTPSRRPPSTIGRCLIQRVAISLAASCSGMSGGTVNTSAVMASSTEQRSGSAPSATARSTSRSVMIPVSRPFAGDQQRARLLPPHVFGRLAETVSG